MPDVGTQPPSELPATPPRVDPPAGIPMAALAYSTPLVARQPGILTAVGVISIVLACLSALTCLFAGLETLGLYIIANVSPQMTQAMTRARPAPLTAAQVAQAVAAVQASSSNSLNPAQLQALTVALQDPNQQLLSPRFTWSPCLSALPDSSGNVTIVFNSGAANGIRGATLDISPAGLVTTTTTTSAEAGNPFAKMKIDPISLSVSLFEDLLSFGLAIYLFVAGILLLRDSPNSRKRLLRFAVIKIFLAIVGGIATCRLAWEFFAGITHPFPGNPPPVSPIVATLAIFFLLSFLYPIALLFTMNSAVVRRHYAQAE